MLEMITTKKETNNIVIDEILVRNFLINVQGEPNGTISNITLGTIFSNLAYYGFILSKKTINRLMSLDDDTVTKWWVEFEPVLKKITGDDKNMADFVVYKNFPQEVLEMTKVEYWINQTFMYMGFDNNFFTEEVVERDPIFEKQELKVLNLASDNSLDGILTSLAFLPAKWTNEQFNDVFFLVNNIGLNINYNDIPFKENQIKLLTSLFEVDNISSVVLSATDTLRLAIGMSEGDVSLKTKTKFRKFKRTERRFLLSLLENSSNLEDDLARNKERFKKLMFALKPGDYAKLFPKVCIAYDKLYNNKTQSFNSKIEQLISSKNKKAINLLKNRPGEFLRRLNVMITNFGQEAAESFVEVADKLTVSQLLKIEMYISTINERKFKTIAPKGNWTKLQILENTTKIDDNIRDYLINNIQSIVKNKVRTNLGIDTVNLSESTKDVKLQTNSSELTTYGRGTIFPIPKNMTFIRSASYWKVSNSSSVWYDNGWNFYDDNWNSMGTCCWNAEIYHIDNDTLSVFSGDPTSSNEMEGRSCQMIDLYLDELEKHQVKYAVWNILCYSNLSFNSADDVFASLQWGDKKQTGELFEPSRSQLSFQIKGSNLTKYIAYIDIKERKLVYMDANLYGNVNSAKSNLNILSEKMPAFVEYLDTLPSIYDLFKSIDKSEVEGKGVNISYDDKELELNNGVIAYVFKPVNENNDFKQLDINSLLN